MTNFFKYACYVTLLLFTVIEQSSSEWQSETSEQLETSEQNKIKIRGRIMNDYIQRKVPCKFISTTNVCECPGACMEPTNTTSHPSCITKKCYAWDQHPGKCINTGPDFTSAIVLQAVPFTGIFGAGFGNIGRWGFFGLGMGIVFVPLFGLCFIACCAVFLSDDTREDTDDSCLKCITNCYGFLWSAAIIAYWIWGIVVIANKSMTAPNGCSFKN